MIDYLNCTTVDRLKDYLKIKAQATQEDATLEGLIQAASSLIALYLDRHIRLTQRVERYDIVDDQRFLWLHGWPPKTDPANPGQYLVELKTDITYPQDWAGDPLAQGDDYLVWPLEKHLGKIEFRCILTGGPQGLQVTYTAGMATKTTIEGTTGQCTDPGGGAPHRFTDANATFETDGITTDMFLEITDNKNGRAGTYPIAAVLSETELEITGSWGGALPGPADEVYIIQGGGLVGVYPQVELACQQQVAYWYKRKEQPEVAAIANAGGNVTYVQTRPIDVKLYGAQALRPEVMLMLTPFTQPYSVYDNA
jgi:hypothetical protein